MNNDKALIRYMRHIDSLLAKIETLENEVKDLQIEVTERTEERDWRNKMLNKRLDRIK